MCEIPGGNAGGALQKRRLSQSTNSDLAMIRRLPPAGLVPDEVNPTSTSGLTPNLSLKPLDPLVVAPEKSNVRSPAITAGNFRSIPTYSKVRSWLIEASARPDTVALPVPSQPNRFSRASSLMVALALICIEREWVSGSPCGGAWYVTFLVNLPLR